MTPYLSIFSSSSSLSYLLHAAVRPSLHPLHGASAVEGRVALAVDGEVGVGAVHDEDDVQVLLNACEITESHIRASREMKRYETKKNTRVERCLKKKHCSLPTVSKRQASVMCSREDESMGGGEILMNGKVSLGG